MSVKPAVAVQVRADVIHRVAEIVIAMIRPAIVTIQHVPVYQKTGEETLESRITETELRADM